MVLWPGCGGRAEFSLHTKNVRSVRFVVKKEGMLLQPLRWCCVDCVIHHERDVREEQKCEQASIEITRGDHKQNIMSFVPKQNNVIRLKSKLPPPQIFGLGYARTTQLGAWVHNTHVVKCISVQIGLCLYERLWRGCLSLSSPMSHHPSRNKRDLY